MVMEMALRAERASAATSGLLRPSLLLQLRDRSAYGYELRGHLARLGLHCDLGTVYRALNALENEGLLLSSWERSEGGRSRRRYELSPAGTGAVEGCEEAVGHVARVAQALLARQRPIVVRDAAG